MAASSSSASPADQNFKYDVFLSFRGEDTRHSFTGFLCRALKKHSLVTFMDDDELGRGEEIAPALLEAIEESRAAAVIFSRNYAASSWCLDELAKIIECHEKRKQIVFPVFYHVDPSHIMKHVGAVGDALATHRKDPKKSAKLPKWRTALNKAALIAGYSTDGIRKEVELVDRIVEDLLKKLTPIKLSLCGLKGLVGMDSRIMEVKRLLFCNSLDTCFLGIWGMAGIGKTTLARAVFEQIADRFDGCCFLENVREVSKNYGGFIPLENELLSGVLEKNIMHCNGPSSIRTVLCGRKVLIVLDDVSELAQIEALAGDRSWFGAGSKIIITSRDKQVLDQRVDSVYEVKVLDPDEALQLFMWHAFKGFQPPKDHEVELNLMAVKYANGNPLALKVLGSSLFRKCRDVWKSAMEKLKRYPIESVQERLKIFYDGLDRHDQEIFLYIACFFKGHDQWEAMRILKSCGFSCDVGISNLIDKCLITVSRFKLEMHDLLQEMGRAIVREKSTDPSEFSKLWDPEDIYQVFSRNTGTKAIEGIFLDMSKLTKQLYLKPDAFEKTPNLKLLKFYVPPSFRGDPKVHLFQGLESLPSNLRYLYWHGYPLKSLPANFHAEHLLELSFPDSEIEISWRGNKDMWKIERIEPSHSQSLIKHPATAQARNPVSMLFDGLCKVVSCIDHYKNLAFISMKECNTIESLPSNFVFPSLEILNLSRCSKLRRFPLVSKNMKELYLMHTAIKEVPSSVKCLTRLRILCMSCCTELEILPNDICKLKSLISFNLSYCSNLKNFPEISETMECLDALILNGTAIEKLPSSIWRQTRLSELSLWGCEKLVYFPEIKLENLDQLHRSGCSMLEMGNGCNPSKLSFDQNRFCCIKRLWLCGLNFESLPEGLNQLPRLHCLNVSYCKRLRSLPELPFSLIEIIADGCTSLETVCALQPNFELPKNEDDIYCCQKFILTNCLKLDQNAWSVCLEQAPLRMQRSATMAKSYIGRILCNRTLVQFCYPGSKIPDWFTYKTLGSSINIRVKRNWYTDRFLGFALCVVVEGPTPNNLLHFPEVGCECVVESNCGRPCGWEYSETGNLCSHNDRIKSKHVIIWYNGLNPCRQRCNGYEAWFRFTARELGLTAPNSSEKITEINELHCGIVQKCAVLPLFAEDEEFGGSGSFEVEEHEEVGAICSSKEEETADFSGSGSSKEEKEEVGVGRSRLKRKMRISVEVAGPWKRKRTEMHQQQHHRLD